MKNKEPIKLVANWKIRRGKIIEPKEEFEADDIKQAKELVAAGAASYVDDEQSTAEEVVQPDIGGEGNDPVDEVPVDETPVDEVPVDEDGGAVELTADERAAVILTVLQEMLEEDPDQKNQMLWTKTKHPRNKAIDARVDFDAVNEEVLAVFESMSVGHGA